MAVRRRPSPIGSPLWLQGRSRGPSRTSPVSREGVRVEYMLIGVPTSAGAHHAGQDLAPAALRSHGLLDRLRGGGLSVTDAGDVAGEVFAVDPGGPPRNLGAVVRVALA